MTTWLRAALRSHTTTSNYIRNEYVDRLCGREVKTLYMGFRMDGVWTCQNMERMVGDLHLDKIYRLIDWKIYEDNRFEFLTKYLGGVS